MRSAHFRSAFVASALAALALSCAESARTMRAATYPPQFAYIEKREVRSLMWTIAADAQALNGALRAGQVSPEDRQRVVELLENMRDAAVELEPPGERTNHPLIDANIDNFRRDIGIALDAAKSDPPNYFFAGAVAGSCLYCHQGG